MRGGIGEEMRIPVGSASRRHKGVTMADLSFHGLELGFERKRHPRAIRPSCKDVLPGLQQLDRQKREAYLIKNRQILRQGSMACLSINDVPVAFPSVIRIEDELAAAPAILTVQLRDGETLSPALVELQSGSNIKLVQLDSADGKPLGDPSFKPLDILHDLKSPEGEDLKSLSGTRTSIVPDDAQMRIPPGEALAVKTPHDTTNQAIRVVCFTDHALGEFLEDLMEIRVPGDQMVCLGGTSTALARPLTLLEQPGVNLQPSHWAQINTTKQRPQNHEHTRGHCQRRQGEVNRCTSSKMEWQRQKSQENAVNPAIDAVIEMAELEEVKSQILLIKAKVETSIRHGTDRNRSGSGSCTSKFLGQDKPQWQVLFGGGFVETTGSCLAHGGIGEVQKHPKSLGRGVYRIDEAYPFAATHNHGGKTAARFPAH
ncbi:NFX1-type zinc finger-containing protein [Marssonina coronariae]|uniref:NFX1-type zinc finger-containing protein n=1 Tax=Diplocarpon coronariae TaxID=2795749 RepID=A0A218YWV0_9HELO|nr:NFX1-type zinc finger-containing protein [Marssonina coronariae]